MWDLQNVGVDIDFVLPLKFSPHAAELGLSAVRRVDIVHDIDMNVVQDDAVAISSTLCVVYNVAKDNASLGGRDFDRCFDNEERVRCKIMCRWAVD